MDEIKLVKDLHRCSGMSYSICRKAIAYCKLHPNCSPIGYIDTMYGGVKYSNLEKEIERTSALFVEYPPYWAKGTEICIPFKNYGLPPINKDSFAEVAIKYDKEKT